MNAESDDNDEGGKYALLGNGWCRAESCITHPEHCYVNGFFRDGSSKTDCFSMCDKTEGCIGLAISSSEYSAYPNRCYIYGEATMSSPSNWKSFPQLSYHISLSSGANEIECFATYTAGESYEWGAEQGMWAVCESEYFDFTGGDASYNVNATDCAGGPWVDSNDNCACLTGASEVQYCPRLSRNVTGYVAPIGAEKGCMYYLVDGNGECSCRHTNSPTTSPTVPHPTNFPTAQPNNLPTSSPTSGCQ